MSLAGFEPAPLSRCGPKPHASAIPPQGQKVWSAPALQKNFYKVFFENLFRKVSKNFSAGSTGSATAANSTSVYSISFMRAKEIQQNKPLLPFILFPQLKHFTTEPFLDNLKYLFFYTVATLNSLILWLKLEELSRVEPLYSQL